MMITNDITWNNVSDGGTGLVGGLMNISFPDLMSRVEALGATNVGCPDGHYENYFRYVGTFKGAVFTLYDAYGIHIGGGNDLDVDGLIVALTALVGGEKGYPTPAYQIAQMLG